MSDLLPPPGQSLLVSVKPEDDSRHDWRTPDGVMRPNMRMCRQRLSWRQVRFCIVCINTGMCDCRALCHSSEPRGFVTLQLQKHNSTSAREQILTYHLYNSELEKHRCVVHVMTRPPMTPDEQQRMDDPFPICASCSLLPMFEGMKHGFLGVLLTGQCLSGV